MTLPCRRVTVTRSGFAAEESNKRVGRRGVRANGQRGVDPGELAGVFADDISDNRNGERNDARRDRGNYVMAVDITTEITIARAVDAVAAYAADPSNAPAWYVNIESVKWETAPPAQPGSKVAFVARFLGRRLAYTYELVDFSPPER